MDSLNELDCQALAAKALAAADLSDGGFGMAILNDCKYGFDATWNSLNITLLKCSTYPDKQADIGHHSFAYALYPHSGTLAESKTVEYAYALNNPCMAIETSGGDGSIADAFSLVCTKRNRLLLDTVKPAEDGQGMIVRAYEPLRRRGKEILQFGCAVQKAYLCDMLENVLEELPVKDGKVELSYKPFEILTVKIV